METFLLQTNSGFRTLDSQDWMFQTLYFVFTTFVTALQQADIAVFQKRENWGLGTLTNLPVVMQPVSGSAKVVPSLTPDVPWPLPLCQCPVRLSLQRCRYSGVRVVGFMLSAILHSLTTNSV